MQKYAIKIFIFANYIHIEANSAFIEKYATSNRLRFVFFCNILLNNIDFVIDYKTCIYINIAALVITFVTVICGILWHCNTLFFDLFNRTKYNIIYLQYTLLLLLIWYTFPLTPLTIFFSLIIINTCNQGWKTHLFKNCTELLTKSSFS